MRTSRFPCLHDAQQQLGSCQGPPRVVWLSGVIVLLSLQSAERVLGLAAAACLLVCAACKVWCSVSLQVLLSLVAVVLLGW
jgi:hypothetical protein